MFNFHCFSAQNKDFGLFLNILGQIESSNNPKAYNKKEKAIGIYQIRLNYFKDAQQFNPKLRKYTHKNCFDPLISRWVVKSYMRHYEPKALKENDFETLARCHNGGCNWRNKKELTNKYWQKFLKISLAIK